VVISASAGICMFPYDTSGTSEMLRNADTAMYAAKQSGSGTCAFYAPAMGRNARASFDIETGLRRALERAELELYFQPQLDLRSGKLCSAEALLRWNRPGVGIITPGSFIGLAEERGLIGAIDTWSLQAATRQLAAWDRAGIVLPRIAVNISASHFHRGNLLQSVTGALQEVGLAAQRLQLEVTESVLLQDSAATLQLMRELRGLGVALAIDDFGTGYSSLSYLRRLPLHELKIDRSFIVEILEDAAVQGIVHGIITLAHGLGLQVIAEGVETQAQLDQLRALDCDFAQGFVLGRPMPAEALAQLLTHDWQAHLD
jgi:EAL domain-containing protein (putative c-di-GMP-specific phosphodiesterase class I)